MRLLLDTQIALWWLTASPRLARSARDLVGRAFCVLSVASIWEVTLKHRIGKLAVAPEPFRDGMREAGALILSITDVHVLGSAALEAAHPDPFDRLLVAVAKAERLTLLTADDALIELAGTMPGLPIQGV